MYMAAARANSATITPDRQKYFITLYIAGWVIKGYCVCNPTNCHILINKEVDFFVFMVGLVSEKTTDTFTLAKMSNVTFSRNCRTLT